jgi:hypothetical protein
MTYREAVQAQIAAIDELYENAGALRDFALSSEKNAWNQARTSLRDLASALRSMDDAMPNAQAQQPLKGNYHFDTSKL